MLPPEIINSIPQEFQQMVTPIIMSVWNNPITQALIIDQIKEIIQRLKKDKDIKEFQTPPVQIFVNALDGYVTNPDNPPVQEMFYNLLKNATDKTKQDLCHPSFPLILKQLSVEDISVLYMIFKQEVFSNTYVYENHKVETEIICRDNTQRFSVNNVFASESLGQLLRLGFLNFEMLEHAYKNQEIKYPMITKYIIQITPHGEQFLKACMSERAEELIKDIINNEGK